MAFVCGGAGGGLLSRRSAWATGGRAVMTRADRRFHNAVTVSAVRSELRMGLLQRAKDDMRKLCDALAVHKLGTALLAAATAGCLMFAPINTALAASGGGRMGGSNFNAPGRTFRGGGGGVPGRAFGGGSRGFGGGGGFGGPIYSAPPIYPIAPLAPGPMISPGFFFGGGTGALLLFGLTLTALPLLTRSRSRSGSYDDVDDAADATTSLCSVKVGLLSSARGLQVDLDNMARSVDTSSARGLATVLNDTVLSLLRNPEYWAYASIRSERTAWSNAEQRFNEMALQERSKLGEETLINVDSRRYESTRSRSDAADLSKAPSEFIVVTLVLAATGALKLPKSVSSEAELRSALQVLGAVRSSSLQAVEVLWSPQSLRDTLSQQEMMKDHPELRPL